MSYLYNRLYMNDFYKKCFCNDKGKLTIAQLPNLPIILALVFVALALIPNLNSDLQVLFSFLATSFLFVWSYLEITQGVNYFRRALGVGVLVILIIGTVR